MKEDLACLVNGHKECRCHTGLEEECPWIKRDARGFLIWDFEDKTFMSGRFPKGRPPFHHCDTCGQKIKIQWVLDET